MFSLLSQLLDFPSSWMPQSGADVYKLCQFCFLSTPLLVPVIHNFSAPFGRFSISSSLNFHGNLGWFVMEVVSPITFILAFTSQPLSTQLLDPSGRFALRDVLSPSLSRLGQLPTVNLILGAAFVIHYLNRAVISPRRSPMRSPMHLSVIMSAIFFNLINGFLMGSWLGGRSPALIIPATALDSRKIVAAVLKERNWIKRLGLGARSVPVALGALNLTPRTVTGPGLSTLTFLESLHHPLWIVGMVGWLAGFLSNLYHDEILLDLRRPLLKRVTQVGREASDDDIHQGEAGKPKYGIPKGGLYEYVSFPNYLCECESNKFPHKRVAHRSLSMAYLPRSLHVLPGGEWLSFAVAASAVTAISPWNPASSSLPLTASARAVISLTSPPFLFLLVEFIPMFSRALQGHAWYRAKFGVEGDGKGGRYPKNRRAIIPGLL